MILALMAVAAVTLKAQTGAWTGKLKVSGVELALIFNIGEESATLDVPDQGAKDIPVEVSRDAVGGITLNVPAKRFVQRVVGREGHRGDFHPARDVVSDDAYAWCAGRQTASDTCGAIPLCYRGSVVHERGRCAERHTDNAGGL